MTTSLPHTLLHFLAGVDYASTARAAVDVLIVAYAVYQLMMLAKPTRAWQMLIGLVSIVLVLSFSKFYELETLNWVFSQILQLGAVALVILFYPELRHALEEVGRFGFWSNSFAGLSREDVSDLVSEIVHAATLLSNRRTGALIVIEREIGLADIVETGTPLNAEVTAELLGTIFYHGSPLHDGAVVIRRRRIAAAGCTLPLTDSPKVGTTIHTRHKAALGISEQSDAVVVVVSEETGIISVALQGNLTRHLRDAALEQKLIQVLQGGKGKAQALLGANRRLAFPALVRSRRGRREGVGGAVPLGGGSGGAGSAGVGSAQASPPPAAGSVAGKIGRS